MIKQIEALKVDAQKLRLELLAYFLDMCLVEATIRHMGSAGDTLGEWKP